MQRAQVFGITIYEFDAVVSDAGGSSMADEARTVPEHVFSWLESHALRNADWGSSAWLRLTQRGARRAVQVTSYVGVIRGPGGFQIEVLPKIGKAIGGGDIATRQVLIEMLRCLRGFRHIQTDSAKLMAARMTLLEVFVWEFLRAVQSIVKRGLRGSYISRQDNLFVLRGKMQIGQHVQKNQSRRDRVFTEYDEFSTDRAENRLLRAALQCVFALTASQASQQLARELRFVFADVPASKRPAQDFQKVCLDRGMEHYVDALAWAKLILDEASPLTGTGGHRAPSLLFPMEAVFEAYVEKHLRRQLVSPFVLKAQSRSVSLVRHEGQDWFRLQPDLLVKDSAVDKLVLDTKWKLLDGAKANGSDKYGLSQADFYQLHAYGQSYLNGQGDVVLIYPKTAAFDRPLPVFDFPKCDGLRLWVVPFCLRKREMVLPEQGELTEVFSRIQ